MISFPFFSKHFYKLYYFSDCIWQTSSVSTDQLFYKTFSLSFFGRLTYVFQKVGEAIAFDAVAMRFYGAEKADTL